MSKILPVSLSLALGLAGLVPLAATPRVVISEVMASTSEYLIDYSRNPPRVGVGPAWFEDRYDADFWSEGPAAVGWGASGLATAVTIPKSADTHALYLRLPFPVTAATSGSAVSVTLEADYSDGLVVYLNGREVARRNLGPVGLPVHHDQPAFRERAAGSFERIDLGTASAVLEAGSNLLAVQVQDSFDSDTQVYFQARLLAGAGELIPLTATWRYFPGWIEPSGGLFDPGLASSPGSLVDLAGLEFNDWIELHNPGFETVDLTGWSLTDDPAVPRQWVFPPRQLGAGEYLVVLASGLDPVPARARLLHANFRLSAEGEYLALHDSLGGLVDALDPGYPPQTPWYSYEPDADGQPRHAPVPSPGRAHDGPWLAERLAAPVVHPEPGFHEGPVTVTLSARQGTVRYTLDGSEPDDTNGLDYTGPIPLTRSTVVRAAAFFIGGINRVPSATVTHTYLINEPTALRDRPAVCLAGDPGRSLFKPYGITAIEGGVYSGSGLPAWHPTGPADYSIPRMDGRAFERPGHLEIHRPDTGLVGAAGLGLRISGSLYSRERFVFNNLAGLWDGDFRQKPMLNFFFRGDYGSDRLEGAIFPDSALRSYDTLRLRSGKNDALNPFIRDELIRRLALDLGQPTAVGFINSLFVNGEFKGYFNLTERYREAWFQEAHDSDAAWDVRQQFFEQVDGDDAFFWEMVDYLQDRPLTTRENYEGAARYLDLVNVADYLILNSYTAMWDWPQNNHTLARERSERGRYRFYVWDAEGGMGMGGHGLNHDTFTSELGAREPPAGEYMIIKLVWKALRASEEFRLLFADRLQRHFFDGGALTAGPMTARFEALREEFAPLLQLVRGEAVKTEWFTQWRDQRAPFYFAQLENYELWPNVAAPDFSYRGEVVPGLRVGLSHRTGAEIFFTTDGTDPRAFGGPPQGTLYREAVPVDRTLTLAARARQGGRWSPLRSFTYVAPPTDDLRVTEIMYHPLPQGAHTHQQLEFLEVHHAGSTEVDLTGVHFVDGIEFTFPGGFRLAPGAYAVLVADAAAFAERYPGVPVHGTFLGQLANGGERLSLADGLGRVLWEATYSDQSPWPQLADGGGHSLVPRVDWVGLPGAPEGWRASTAPGGSPGQADPWPTDLLLDRLFPEVLPDEQGWLDTWLGLLQPDHFPWIFTPDHGWLYCAGSDAANVWLYDPQLGWWWTSAATYPFLYGQTGRQWLLYYLQEAGFRWFYAFGDADWQAVGRN